MSLEDLIDDEFRELATFGVAENIERITQRWIDLGLPEDFARSDTMQRIAETMAKEKNDLALQGAFYSQEAMPTRAHLRSSVVDGFSLFDFQPKRRVRSTVDLTFSIDNPHPVDIKIPRKTVVSHENTDATVLTTKETILTAGSTEVTVETGEGVLKSKEVVSQGESNFTTSIPSNTVAENGLEIFVDGTLWEQVDTLQRALQTTPFYEAYEVRTLPDETLEILFGDNLQGKIPPEGDTVRIEYIETRGAFRIEQADTITGLESTITDITGTDVTDQINVTNGSEILDGGSERQDVDQIQFLAPQIFQTGQRAVSELDHEAITIDYPSVLTANAIGERSADRGDPEWARRAEVYVVRERDQDGNPLPVDHEFAYGGSGTPRNPDPDSLAGELLDVGNPVLIREIKGADLVWFFVRSDIRIDPGVEPSVVRSNIQDVLDENLRLEDEPDRKIGDAIRHSNVVDLIDRVPDIDHHYTHLITFVRGNFTSTSQTFGIQDFTTPNTDYHLEAPFQRGEIRIKDLDGDLIAEDDGNNNLLPGPNETNFTGGRVNYTDPDFQILQSDVNAGNSVTIDVEDATSFLVGDRVEISDDFNLEEFRVQSVDESNDTITGDLNNSYSASDDVKVDKLWTLDVNWSTAPNEIYQVELECKDPREGRTFRDGDVLVSRSQFPVYRGNINDLSFQFTSETDS